MHIKLQNFLFLIGASYIAQLLFISTLAFILYLFNAKDWIYDLIYDSIPLIALILGIINLCNIKVAKYIYIKSIIHLPRLQWYSMFIAYVVICQHLIKMDGTIYLMAVELSCIIAALCYPKRTWGKRFTSAFIFIILLWFTYLCEYPSFNKF